MTITALTDLSKLPNQSQDQVTFDANMAYLIDNLGERARQENELAASMGVAASGSANKIPYKIDLGTTMADPTAGWLRFNASTQNAATAIALDIIGADAVDYTGPIGAFAGSTSAVLGQLRLEKQGDATKFLLFNLTAMTSPTGYRQLTVTCVGSSAASPFVQADQVTLSFQRTGDKGDTGAAAINPAAKFSDRKAGGTSGGSNVAGEQTRTLNTTDYNTIGATLSSNQVTLQAGTYDIRGRAPAHAVGYHRAALYNVTDAVYALVGSAEYASPTGSAQSSSHFSGRIVLTSAKTFSVQHYMGQVTSSTGLGNGVSASGTNSTFTELDILKAA